MLAGRPAAKAHPARDLYSVDKKLSYYRGTARHIMSVEILSTAAQLYKDTKIPFEKVVIGEWS